MAAEVSLAKLAVRDLGHNVPWLRTYRGDNTDNDGAKAVFAGPHGCFAVLFRLASHLAARLDTAARVGNMFDQSVKIFLSGRMHAA